MEPGSATLGRSLLVPCVQEMAKQGVSTVPDRYIRPDRDDSEVSDDRSSEVPVIDMQMLLQGHSDELANLHSACRDWGFFQLVNHGVSLPLLNKMKRETQDFFNLPIEEKKRFWQTPGEVEGYGQAFVVSDEQKLDWADIFFFNSLPLSMRKPHLMPRLPLPYRETVESYSNEMKNLALAIISRIADALGIEEKEMRGFFEDGLQAMRMNYYPPCPEPKKVIGLNPHSDAVGLTILLQVSKVQGLELKKDGKWVPVMPLPNAFVVNIGDMLEIITNGVYRSIEHRATVNSESERISIATFYSTNYDGKIGPASSLITCQTPALFKTMKTQDYFTGLFSRELDGKSYLDTLRIGKTKTS